MTSKAPGYERLTPDDLLDLAQGELHWEEERLKGVAFHLVSAISAAGRTGVTVVGDSPDEEERRYRRVIAVLDRESAARE
ncbi:MAG: peptide ligase PGM1-related protein [Actinomycetota bacterium]